MEVYPAPPPVLAVPVLNIYHVKLMLNTLFNNIYPTKNCLHHCCLHQGHPPLQYTSHCSQSLTHLHLKRRDH